MATEYNNLKELRIKRQLLKNEVRDLEDLITFENTKESLSAITNGFTDQFLKEEIDEDGSSKLSLNTGNIVKEVSLKLKDNLNKNSVMSFATSNAGASVAENALKMGLVAFTGNYAQKNLASSSWKKKAIGLALIYVAPIVLKYVREKLEEYQKNKVSSSFEQLI